MRPALTNDHIYMRKLLICYMAEYTNSTSPPRDVKIGFFAIHMTDTNMVWLGETNNFGDVLRRFQSGGRFADSVEKAKERGAKLELWFLTQPQRFSAQELEDHLIRIDKLAERKERDLSGKGVLYCIRHKSSHDYFVITDRNNTAPTTLLSNFLTRLNTLTGDSRNKHLDKFINEQASDILKGTGFDITDIDKFEDSEDAWLKRQVYIDDCRYGRNLNWHSVE